MNLLNRTFFISFSEHVSDEIGHVTSCQRDMLDATIDDKTISYRNNMSHSVSWIQNCSSIANTRIDARWWNEGKYCLNSDIEPLCVECFEHDLCQVFSVFRRIEGRFSHNKDCFLGIASEIVEHAPVPILLHQIPVPDDTSFDRIDNFLSSSELSCFLSNDKIKGLCNFPITHSPANLWALIARISDQSRDIKGRLGISCVSHLGVASSIIDDNYFGIDIHQRYIYKLKARNTEYDLLPLSA